MIEPMEKNQRDAARAAIMEKAKAAYASGDHAGAREILDTSMIRLETSTLMAQFAQEYGEPQTEEPEAALQKQLEIDKLDAAELYKTNPRAARLALIKAGFTPEEVARIMVEFANLSKN